ncbi:MAG: hypothetical protein M1561_03410 [Gammaproteobacteria bacterium]|nr:hypothetical protein [Gammaproteobacteria bacterium]
MKKLVKLALVVSAFAFVLGCSTTDKPVQTAPATTFSSVSQSVKAGKHHKQRCGKHHKCHGKLSSNEDYKGDVAK